MNIRTLAVALFTVATLTLTGCSDMADQPEAATTGAAEGPEASEATYTEIPASTIEAYFPETASGDDKKVDAGPQRPAPGARPHAVRH